MKRNYCWTDSLTGTAEGTVFEHEEWVNKLFECKSDLQINKLIKEQFNNRYDFYKGKIIQCEQACWSEMYGLLSLFRGDDHLMFSPISENCFDINSLSENCLNKIYEYIKDGYIFVHMKWISENHISVYNCIEEKDLFNESVLETKNHCWLSGSLDRNGNLKEPYQIHS